MSKPPSGTIVKHLRETRRYTQAEFAKMAGISKDALSRIERGKPKGTRPRQKTLENLAKAFDVKPEMLTGEMPLLDSEDDNRTYLPRSSLGVRIDGTIDNAFVLVAERYRIPVERIVELAPFLFVLAAERSLDQRRQRLTALKEMLDRANDMAESILDQPRMIELDADTHDWICTEEVSIYNRNILMEDLEFRRGKEEYFFGFCENNPFVRSLQKDAPDPAIAEINLVSSEGVRMRVGRAEAMRHAENDEALATDIQDGWVILREMPVVLQKESAGQERLIWLREQVARGKKAQESAWVLKDGWYSAKHP